MSLDNDVSVSVISLHCGIPPASQAIKRMIKLDCLRITGAPVQTIFKLMGPQRRRVGGTGVLQVDTPMDSQLQRSGVGLAGNAGAALAGLSSALSIVW